VFAREATEDPKLKAYLESVILLKNDCEKGAGVDLAKKYEVGVYPTFAMVNEHGEVTDRWAGYPGVDEFIGKVDQARADMSTIEEKKTRFRAEPTYDLALRLGMYSEAVFASVDAVDYYRKAMALNPSASTELRSKIFMSMYYGLRSGTTEPALLLGEGEAILNDPAAGTNDVLMVASVIRRISDQEHYVPVLKKALARTADDQSPEVQKYRQELLVDEALMVHGDADKALELKRATFEEGWQQDPMALNQFAWWCFENDLNLPEAYELAVAGADLAADDGTKANILDTAAEIAFKLGKVDKAIEHQTEAVRLAPDNEGFKHTLAKFQAGIDT
jgi:tetratricopeptide (TPR) repeat protein